MSSAPRIPQADALADFDLGSYRRVVTTRDRVASEWFNRGLVWSYAFNHEAAVACFEKAVQVDEQCVMAYWGIAYALGPNYNKPWTVFDREEKAVVLKRTHNAVRSAQAHAARASPVEHALINALRFRYQSQSTNARHDTWNRDYANAMRVVYRNHPQDLDVAALFADALMNLTPWALWNVGTGLPAEGAYTLEIESVLDRALSTDQGLAHPGLLHFYIHFWELSPLPDAALPIANRLRGLVPDAGHLNHMPSHLDVLCGNYREAVDANSAAAHADEKYLEFAGSINFYSLYRLHDYHFLIYAAMFSARSKVALETVARLEASLPEELLRLKSPPMADWLESFLSSRPHVLIRFGRWDDILTLPLPKDQKLYACTTAITIYAKALAYAATGRIQQAQKERERFVQARKLVPLSRTLFNNSFIDILEVAASMLDGEIEYRRQNYDEAFEHLRRAIRLDDGLPYDEPWGWMQPTRHAYGALLLEQGLIGEAAVVYRADLGLDHSLPRALRHPNNIWSLHGYHECLIRLGEHEEAKEISQQLAQAQRYADVTVSSSCFCRLHTLGSKARGVRSLERRSAM